MPQLFHYVAIFSLNVLYLTINRQDIITFATFSDFNCKDDPDIPLTEEDYKRRRPHPNFKEHTSTEKLVLKLGKTVKIHPKFQFIYDMKHA